MTETVLSQKNPLLKEVRRAASRGSLTGDGFAIAEGFHLLEEAVASRIEIAVVIVAESAQSAVEPLARGLDRTRVVAVPDPVFAGLTTTEQPQGVIALVRMPHWTMEDVLPRNALAVILDGVQDPGNAGAAVRSAEAFGATGVVFLKGTVSPYNPKCLRASAGSLFRIPVAAGITGNAIVEAARGIHIYAAMPRAERLLAHADLRRPCGIVIGGEGRGVGEELALHAQGIRIPTRGVESLNAAVACGVLLYEAQRQRTESRESEFV